MLPEEREVSKYQYPNNFLATLWEIIWSSSSKAHKILLKEWILLAFLSDIRNSFFWPKDMMEKNISRYEIDFSDTSFLTELNKHIRSDSRMITSNSKKDSYEEVLFLLFLISYKLDLNIFLKWNIYDLKTFNQLFIEFRKKWLILQTNEEKRHYIELFVSLCWVINSMWILNQNDTIKRDDMLAIIDALLQNIDLFKDCLNGLDDEEKEKFEKILDYYHWIINVNMSHTRFIPLKKTDEWDIDVDNFLDEYEKITNNIIRWYKLCLKSDKERAKNNLYIFLWNLNYVLSIILLKLSSLTDEQKTELSKNDKFKKIIKNIFSAYWIDEAPDDIDFEYLKNFTKNNFLSIYEWDLIQKYYSWKTLDEIWSRDINVFIWNIILKWDFLTDDMKNETLHHLVLFCDDISIENLFKIWYILLSQEKSENKTFEINKLKILNIILTKLSRHSNKDILKDILVKVEDYIDDNRTSSQLLFLYSLDYLTIWYCYSFFNDEYSQKKALENYAKFKQINRWNGENFDFSRYWIDIDKFRLNIWIRTVVDLWLCSCWLAFSNCDLDLWNCKFTKKELINVWKKTMDNEFEAYHRESISTSLTRFQSYLTKNWWVNRLDLWKLTWVLSEVLSSIFHWIAIINIVDWKTEDIPSYKDRYIKELENGFSLEIVYPNTFKKFFDDIFEWNKDLINDIIEELIEYLKKFKERNKDDMIKIDEFEKALDEWRVELLYQPICDKNWNTIKTEVLSRIRTKDWEKLISIFDYIKAINKTWTWFWLLKRLLRFLANETFINSKLYDSFEFSINLEYSDLIDEELIHFLYDFKSKGFDTNKITIELIEWKWENDELAFAWINRLKTLWFKIAMDDFWAWDSAITRLWELWKAWLLDFVKIDWQIIKWLMSKDKREREVSKLAIEFTVNTCKVFKIPVVAEYVANQDILNTCIDLWVELFQWEYFSMPITLKDVKQRYWEEKEPNLL